MSGRSGARWLAAKRRMKRESGRRRVANPRLDPLPRGEGPPALGPHWTMSAQFRHASLQHCSAGGAKALKPRLRYLTMVLGTVDFRHYKADDTSAKRGGTKMDGLTAEW